jgi:hypothetical protein
MFRSIVMKTTLNSPDINIHRFSYPIVEKNSFNKIKILSFRRNYKNKSILKLGVTNINDSNYRVYLNGHRLSLIISEHAEYSKPIYMHNIDHKFYDRETYEVLRNFIIWMPEVNMDLVKYYIMPHSQILKVIMEKSA